MSFYLEQLEKKGIKLKYEQYQARKALKLPKRKVMNRMRLQMDELVAREFKRKQA